MTSKEEARYHSDKATFENPDFMSYCNKNFGGYPEELSDTGLSYYRVKQENYLKCLAAYYYILYSHFYIDSVSVPNQIEWRENSKAELKLDNENIEKNFSKEKERLPYGGVIQGYDEKLLKNI